MAQNPLAINQLRHGYSWSFRGLTAWAVDCKYAARNQVCRCDTSRDGFWSVEVPYARSGIARISLTPIPLRRGTNTNETPLYIAASTFTVQWINCLCCTDEDSSGNCNNKWPSKAPFKSWVLSWHWKLHCQKPKEIYIRIKIYKTSPNPLKRL